MSSPRSHASRTRGLLVVVSLCVLCCCVDGAADDGATAEPVVTLPFSVSVTLVNATSPRTDYNVSPTFAHLAELTLSAATKWPAPIATTTSSLPPDIVLTTTTWVQGTAASAAAERQQLQTFFDTWRLCGNAPLAAGLTQVALQFTGRQPALVTPTTACAFYADTLTPRSTGVCLRNLTVSFFTPRVTDGAALRALLCAVLPTSCNLVVLDAVTRTSVHSPFSGAIAPQTRLDYRIYARDRNTVLATLLQYAQYASALSSQEITYILVNNTEVYYNGNHTEETVDGSIADCVSHYWYLIFLVLVLLVLMVLSQRCYYVGRASGRRSARKMEQEIRAGQHMASMLQSSYGYAPPPPQLPQQPPPGTMRYNYVPPAYEQSMLASNMTSTMHPTRSGNAQARDYAAWQ